MYDFEIRDLMLRALAEIWVRLGVATVTAINVGSVAARTPPVPALHGDVPWPDEIGVHVALRPGPGAPQWHEQANEWSLESTDSEGTATTWCHIVRDPETRAFHWEVSLERTHEGEADSLELAQLCGVSTILRWLPGRKTT